METLWQDIKFGARMLAKHPGFTAVAVLTLALGIGANTSVFSVVNGVLLRPLPYPEPDRMAMVWLDNRRQGVREDITSYPNYLDVRQRSQTFEHLAGFSQGSMNLTGQGEPERLVVASTTANFFQVTGVQPSLGRAYSEENEKPGEDRFVLLSHGFWQRRFGGSRDALGQKVELNGQPHEIIGVMPPGFQFPAGAEMWSPLAPGDRLRAARFNFWLPVVGRMKRGVTPEEAQAEMNTIGAALESEYPDIRGYGLNVVPLHEQVVGKIRTELLVLFSAVGFVLLIACANVANLLLARSAGRSRELAIRSALGAGRGRLLRQMLTESVLLSMAGGALGLLVAVWGRDAFLALLPGRLPRAEEIGLDGTVLLFTSLLAVLTGVVFGLLPAFEASRRGLAETLKEGARASASLHRTRFRSALVAGEVAVAVVLLAGAGLMLQSFFKLSQVDTGFRTRNTLTFNLFLPGHKYTAPQLAPFYEQLLERLRALPGVEAASATTGILLPELPNSAGFTIEGKPRPPVEQRVELPFDRVALGYFETLQVPLIRGRFFNEQDRGEVPQVAIINETMVRMFFPGEDPLGKRFKFGGEQSDDPWKTIVGVVRDTRRTGLAREIRPESYFPIQQFPARGMTLVMRATGDPAQLAGAVRTAVRDADAELPVYNVRTLDEQVDAFVAQPRFTMILLGTFAGIALLLAALGIYGVLASAVAQRTQEIGVRMAFGAGPREIFRLVVGQGMAVVGIGLVAGLAGALALTRLLKTLLFGVAPHDPLTFVAAIALLAGAAFAACSVPARRATKVDPMAALRYE